MAEYIAHVQAKPKHEAPPFRFYAQEQWRHYDGDDYGRMYMAGWEL